MNKITRFYAVLHYVPGPELSYPELAGRGCYIRTELTRDKTKAIEMAKKHINAVAVEEIGKGIIWVQEAI